MAESTGRAEVSALPTALAREPIIIQHFAGIQVPLEREAHPASFQPHFLIGHNLIDNKLAGQRVKNLLARLTALNIQAKASVSATEPLPQLVALDLSHAGFSC